MTPAELDAYLQGLQDGLQIGRHISRRRPIAPEDRFWAKVNKTDDCWYWTGGRTQGGYGVFRPSPTTQGRAHQFSYQLHHGPIPLGMVVRHTCDNPPCVNPAHLLIGTVADNNRDKAERGRSRNGGTRRSG